jgi:signal transduction histidine kinase
VSQRDVRWGLLSFVGLSGSWALAQVGFLVAPITQLKLGSYVIGLILGFASIGAWLYFCSAYTGRGYHRKPFYRRLALLVFGVVVAAKVTNPLHHAYFTTRLVTEPFAHLAVQTAPLHWAGMGLSYALAFVGFFMLLELFTAVEYDTRSLGILVGLTGFPIAFDIVGYTTPFLLDMTYEPLGVGVFALGVAFVHLERFEAVRLAAEHEHPVISLTTEGCIRDTNQPALEVFPNVENARGQPLSTTLPSVANHLQSEDAIFEFHRDGSTRYFRVAKRPSHTAKAGLGETLVFVEVTERERYREELERQNQRLEQFANIVSHDLRNPLNVAHGRLTIARESCESDNEHFEGVEQALTRMDNLIDEVLSFAQDGQPVEETESLSLSTLAQECWEMVETSEDSLTVADDITIEGDKMRLQRVFENLFRNAVDHAETDVSLTVGALPGDTGFYIEDDGPGISTGDWNEIFEPGYTTHSSGTGFGLAIVEQIVEAHGWAIQACESEAGGVRFEITGVGAVDVSQKSPKSHR